MRVDESSYLCGQRAVWTELLRRAVEELGAEAPDYARHTIELAEARAAAETLGRDLGLYPWPEQTHLADVIEKWIGRNVTKKG